MIKNLKYILKYNDVLISLSISLTICSYFYQLYFLLFLSFICFFLFIMTEDLKTIEENNYIFDGDELIPLKIETINLIGIKGEEFLFIKSGIHIYKFITYKNESYEYFNEVNNVNLNECQTNCFLIGYPGVIYKKK